MNKVIIVFLFAVIIQGCASMRPVSPNGPEMADSKQGEFIRIHFKDGTMYEGKFKFLSSDSIEVSSRKFAIENIQFIEKSKMDGVKTAGAAVGALLGAYVIVGLIVIGSFFYMVGQALE